jgi:molybdopterin adenylyltransferase
MFRLAVLTISTSGYQGNRSDTSGQAIQSILSSPNYNMVRYEVIADDQDAIANCLAQWADDPTVDLIICTGGTGLGQRDITPEACRSIIDREIPGLAEAMRAETLKFTPMAMLSRSVAGIRNGTLIITLPGSPDGVQQCLEVIKPVLPHALELLQNETVNNHPT